MARIDIEIDVDDMYWEMSKREKQEMADKLYDDGYVPEALQSVTDRLEDRITETNLERNLSDLLDKLWSNRLFLTNDDIQTITTLAKKGI
jgi:hypothetical protein